MKYSKVKQIKQWISNFNNSLRKWITHYKGLEKYNLPPKQGRKEKVEELLADCKFIWATLEVGILQNPI